MALILVLYCFPNTDRESPLVLSDNNVSSDVSPSRLECRAAPKSVSGEVIGKSDEQTASGSGIRIDIKRITEILPQCEQEPKY